MVSPTLPPSVGPAPCASRSPRFPRPAPGLECSSLVFGTTSGSFSLGDTLPERFAPFRSLSLPTGVRDRVLAKDAVRAVTSAASIISTLLLKLFNPEEEGDGPFWPLISFTDFPEQPPVYLSRVVTPKIYVPISIVYRTLRNCFIFPRQSKPAYRSCLALGFGIGRLLTSVYEWCIIVRCNIV